MSMVMVKRSIKLLFFMVKKGMYEKIYTIFYSVDADNDWCG